MATIKEFEQQLDNLIGLNVVIIGRKANASDLRAPSGQLYKASKQGAEYMVACLNGNARTLLVECRFNAINVTAIARDVICLE